MITTAREPLSQSDLAHRPGVEGATLVSKIDRLVKAGRRAVNEEPTRRADPAATGSAGHGGGLAGTHAQARSGPATAVDHHLSPLGWEHINLTGDYTCGAAAPRSARANLGRYDRCTRLNVLYFPFSETTPITRSYSVTLNNPPLSRVINPI